MGNNVSSFNISLTELPLNETGNGTLCLPTVKLPTKLNVQDGANNASIQISTVGPEGAALYNCADITFSSKATVLSGDACKNDTGIGLSVVGAASAPPSKTDSDTPSSTTTSAGAAGGLRVNNLAYIGGLTAFLALGL
ncbi:MAG: hypothetical protein M1839_004501 [Geoglossum umbratile]|nr:MAG: hypothetical protein M1839_004501 [Geoglossum umbratile]